MSESDFSMYGTMFVSFQSRMCGLNISYPNVPKCCSFSNMILPVQRLQLFNKFASIGES